MDFSSSTLHVEWVEVLRLDNVLCTSGGTTGMNHDVGSSEYIFKVRFENIFENFLKSFLYDPLGKSCRKSYNDDS